MANFRHMSHLCWKLRINAGWLLVDTEIDTKSNEKVAMLIECMCSKWMTFLYFIGQNLDTVLKCCLLSSPLKILSCGIFFSNGMEVYF